MRLWNSKEEAVSENAAPAFQRLHWVAAGLFLAAGAEAALAARRTGSEMPGPLRWAPVIAAPLAGAAHAARAMRPSAATRTAASLLNGLAIGVGAAGVLAGAYAARSQRARRRAWSLPPDHRPLAERITAAAPLTFGATGILGLVLDHEEQSEADARHRLERRASLVERLVPKRRARIDHVVVHV